MALINYFGKLKDGNTNNGFILQESVATIIKLKIYFFIIIKNGKRKFLQFRFIFINSIRRPVIKRRKKKRLRIVADFNTK